MKQFNWHKIQWMPFFNTQEIINVGVVVSDDKNNILNIKLIEDLSKVKFFFGDSIISDASLAFDVVRVMVSGNTISGDIDTPQVKIRDQGIAFSNSVALLTEQLMSQVVTAYKVKERKSRYSPLTTKRLLTTLKDKVPDIYKGYIPDNPFLEVKPDLSVYIPMRKNGLSDVATVISADYLDIERRSTRFYEAMRDLSLVNMVSKGKTNSKSAFVLKPQGITHLSNSLRKSIDGEIEMFKYQAKDRSFEVVICDDSDDFVTKALSWCA
ncbi:MAG: DUF3037 domain-containing protein [Rahnella inusitata]|jgi:hypothetical protein